LPQFVILKLLVASWRFSHAWPDLRLQLTLNITHITFKATTTTASTTTTTTATTTTVAAKKMSTTSATLLIIF